MDYRGGEGDKFNTHDRVIYIFIILFIQTHRLLKPSFLELLLTNVHDSKSHFIY